MTRYIDADPLIAPLKEEYKKIKQAFDETSVFQAPNDVALYGALMQELGAIIGMIEDAPIIDAEPVRHGKWIIRDNPGTGWYRVTCSECGEDVTSTAPCIGFFPNAKVSWNYCPNCGADMRGK